MMYQIAYNGEFIYGEDEDKTVLDPSLEIELNAAGTLTITIPVENEAWSQFEVFRGEVVVYEGDDIIWFGRPLQIVRDWLNRKVVTCEGALAYFNDSLQVTKEYKQDQTPLYTDTSAYPGKTGFINDIIGLHNDQVESNRKIYIGEIDIDNELVYRYVDYETTADILQQMCLDTNGGYFILRKAVDETTGELRNYLDWRKEVPYSTDQPVEFGVNLLDLNQDLNGADICTVLLPTGANDLNISTVQVYSEDDPNHPPYHIDDPEGDVLHSSGSVYMTHMQGYKRFGRVVKTKDFSAIADKDSLFQKAAEWLNEQNTDVTTIECSVADLHYLKGETPDGQKYEDYGKLRIGQSVWVGSGPHDIGRRLPIYKVSMKLDSGAKTITLGTPPKRELTDIVKNNGGSTRGSSGATGTGGGSDSSGGGSGSTYIPVTDVKVKMPGENNFATVVKKRIAQIDLSELDTDAVQDVKVNGTSVVDENKVANVTVPDVPVQDVYLDGASVLDNNGIAQLTSPVIPDVPVQDVQVDDVSIVDQNGIAKLTSPTIPVQDVTLDDVSVVDNNGIAKLISVQSPVSDVLVKLTPGGSYQSAVVNRTARIDLSSQGVRDIQMNGGSIINSGDVAEFYLEGNPEGSTPTDVLTTLKIGSPNNVVVYSIPGGGGTTVIANPSGTSTDELTKLQVGNDIYDVVSPTELGSAVSALQTNFQAGVDAIYDACVAKGSTPESHSLSDVVDGIMDIPTSPSQNLYELATPAMTSNTTPSGVCSASEIYSSPNYEPWYAFSGTLGGDAQSWCTRSQTTGAWIQYEFPTAVIITKIATTNRNLNTPRACKRFKFQGSNDGVTYVDLGDEYIITSDAKSYRQEFYIPNQTAYTHYRIYVTEAYNTARVGFGQIELYKSTTVAGKVVTQNGLYNAADDGFEGYNAVLVKVSKGEGDLIDFSSEVGAAQLDEVSATVTLDLSDFTLISEAGGV